MIVPPHIQAPLTRAFIVRFSDEAREKLPSWRKKFTPHSIKFMPNACYWVFSKEHKDCLQNLGCKSDITNVGHPKLSKLWRDAISQHLIEEVKASATFHDLDDSKIITVLLTAPDYIWYPPNSSQKKALLKVIGCIRRNFPKNEIVLKSKPRYANYSSTLLNEAGLGEGLSSNNSLPALASRSLFAVSINETSAIFDFLFAGVRVVEYADYSEDWLMRLAIESLEGPAGFSSVRT